MSFYSIETENQDDDRQWLTYWVIFGLLTLLDQGNLLTEVIPFYYFFKLIVLVWLFHPQTQGASVVYENVIYPIWREHEGKIEEITRKFEGMVE